MRKLFLPLFILCSAALHAADYDLSMTSIRMNGSELSPTDSITCTINLKNAGEATDPITSVCIKVSVNDNTIFCDTLTDLAIGSKVFSFKKRIHHGIYKPSKDVELKGEAYILDADKVDADLTNNSKSRTFSVVGKLAERKVVIEEATGFWCGFCPSAIMAMEYLSETYPDDFIGIAVHSGDAFHNANYINGLHSSFGSFGFPSAWTNRAAVCGTNQTAFAGSYKEQKAIDTEVDPKVTAVYDEETGEITATMETRFYYVNSDADYRGVFVVIENGIEGYAQANKLSNTPGLGPFTGGGSYVSITFNHIALDIQPSYSGTKGSFPSSIDYDVPYIYTETFAAPSKISNLNNVEIVGLVLDKNGKITNADKAKLQTTTGIDSITSQTSKKSRFFDLSGREIRKPEAGSIYIEVLPNGKSVKRVAK